VRPQRDLGRRHTIIRFNENVLRQDGEDFADTLKTMRTEHLEQAPRGVSPGRYGESSVRTGPTPLLTITTAAPAHGPVPRPGPGWCGWCAGLHDRGPVYAVGLHALLGEERKGVTGAAADLQHPTRPPSNSGPGP
jgi:hypothetical protein